MSAIGDLYVFTLPVQFEHFKKPHAEITYCYSHLYYEKLSHLISLQLSSIRPGKLHVLIYLKTYFIRSSFYSGFCGGSDYSM